MQLCRQYARLVQVSTCGARVLRVFWCASGAAVAELHRPPARNPGLDAGPLSAAPAPIAAHSHEANAALQSTTWPRQQRFERVRDQITRPAFTPSWSTAAPPGPLCSLTTRPRARWRCWRTAWRRTSSQVRRRSAVQWRSRSPCALQRSPAAPPPAAPQPAAPHRSHPVRHARRAGGSSGRRASHAAPHKQCAPSKHRHLAPAPLLAGAAHSAPRAARRRLAPHALPPAAPAQYPSQAASWWAWWWCQTSLAMQTFRRWVFCIISTTCLACL